MLTGIALLLIIMTEEKNTNTESVAQEALKSVVEDQQVVTGEENDNARTSDRPVHKHSNLRGRWKRNSATTRAATIKEADTKTPKEIKTVKIASAERIEKPFEKKSDKRTTRFEGKEKCTCKSQQCCCCSVWGKIKCFILKLFGFKSKKNEKPHSHHYRGQRKRNYRSNSRSQSRQQ